MWSLIAFAALVGMHHALEADHVAAVSSLATGHKRLSDIVRQGITWGIGHTVTLFLFAGIALLLGHAIPKIMATYLEAAVGVMLVGLGAHVFWRLWREPLHVHVHRHGERPAHLHIHSHAFDAGEHPHSLHDDVHRFSWRTLLVGMTHGMAGSAALLLLTISQTRAAWEGLVYVLLFGVGSIAGMAVVSLAIGLPLTWTAKSLEGANRCLQIAVGIITIAIGASAIHATVFAAPM